MLTVAEEAVRELPMSPWAFGGIALVVFILLLILVFQFDRGE